MRQTRVREPRPRKLEKEKILPGEPTYIVSEQLCLAVASSLGMWSEMEPAEILKLLRPLLDMQCNVREPQQCQQAQAFKAAWHDWTECEKQYLYRYYTTTPYTMLEVVEKFRPHKIACGLSPSPTNNPKEHCFLAGLYEEYVGVLLCWQEYIQSLKKKGQQAYLEEFYRELEQVVEAMDLPFTEKPIAH